MCQGFFVTWFSFSFSSCFVESIWCTIIFIHSNHFTIFELKYCIFNYLTNIFLFCRRRMLLLAVALICITTKQLWVLTSLSLFRNGQIYVLMLIPRKYKSFCLCFNKLMIQMPLQWNFDCVFLNPHFSWLFAHIYWSHRCFHRNRGVFSWNIYFGVLVSSSVMHSYWS